MISLATFQRINEINETTNDSIERLAYMVCLVFGYSEERVNHMHEIVFSYKCEQLKRMLVKKPSRWRSLRLQTDATKITLGQFIECQAWVKRCPKRTTNGIEGVDFIPMADFLAASLLMKRSNHAADVLKVQKIAFNRITHKVQSFIESMNDLIASYKGLFEIEESENDEPLIGDSEEQHPFIEQYGWIFSAKEVANHEGITLNEAFKLPVVQAFNALAYLKSKQSYDKIKNK